MCVCKKVGAGPLFLHPDTLKGPPDSLHERGRARRVPHTPALRCGSESVTRNVLVPPGVTEKVQRGLGSEDEDQGGWGAPVPAGT